MIETPAQHLAKLIETSGPVPVSTFMQVALAHPDHGYYRARAAIGADGDFVTAPEISQLFGEMIGIWVLQSWFDLGAPRSWHLIELGPGRGTLMSDIVRTLRLRLQALEDIRIHLVETSTPLRALQREALGEMTAVAAWHDNFDAVPAGPGVIVANEFFDALPIRQFLKLKGVWCERRVALAATSDPSMPRFRLIAEPTLLDVEHELPQARASANGEIVEFSAAARAVASMLGRRLAAQRSRALIIDYGYWQERHGDTLQALHRHTKQDPLEDVGAADVTAHVDFLALAAAARTAGAVPFGPVTQREFLVAMGIETRLAALSKGADASQKQMLERGVHRLTSPAQMGDLFRVLALSSPQLPAPPGFESVQ